MTWWVLDRLIFHSTLPLCPSLIIHCFSLSGLILINNTLSLPMMCVFVVTLQLMNILISVILVEACLVHIVLVISVWYRIIIICIIHILLKLQLIQLTLEHLVYIPTIYMCIINHITRYYCYTLSISPDRDNCQSTAAFCLACSILFN